MDLDTWVETEKARLETNRLSMVVLCVTVVLSVLGLLCRDIFGVHPEVHFQRVDWLVVGLEFALGGLDWQMLK